jgi:ADP-ribosyl-[dinitrogen reductase] hydrolase
VIKTSENDPLYIDCLPLGQGLIGMTICPGRYAPDAWSGPCERSLEADLRAIQEWGAGVIVTLMEDREIDDLKVFGLRKAVPAHGMSWWHLPVQDGLPLEYHGDGFTERGDDRWCAPCALLREFLHKGGRVLIHCRGGLGRTGTLAARLLIEDGVPPKTALREVRRVRPGAVETDAQERYLLNYPAPQDSANKFADSRPWRPRWDALSGIPNSVLEDAAAELLRNPERFSLQVWRKALRESGAINPKCWS